MSRKVLADLSLKLSANSAELKRGIEESRRQMGTLQRTTADVGKNVAASFAKMAVAVAAVKKAFDVLKSTINSTQTTGDELAKTMGGMREATLRVQQAIATADFSNFTQNMKDAYEAGREYVNVLDELADRSRAVDIGAAQAKYELVRLRGIASNTGLDDNVRLEAAREMERIAMAQLDREKAVKQGYIDNELNNLKERWKLNDAQLRLLREYTSTYDLLGDSLMPDVQKFMDAYMSIRNIPQEFRTVQTSYGAVQHHNEGYEQDMQQWRERKQQATQYYDLLSEEQRAYADLMVKLGGANMNLYTDEMRDSLAKAEKDMWGIMMEFQMFLNQSGRYEGRLLASMAKEGGATTDVAATLANVLNSEFYTGTMQMLPAPDLTEFMSLPELMGTGVLELNNHLDESMNKFMDWASVGSSAAGMIAASIVDMAMGVEQNIGDIIKQLLRMVAVQLLSNFIMSMFGGGGAMAGGVLMNPGGMASGLNLNIPQMASGGIAYGPSIVQVGEYPGARLDPEIISRASDLRNILGFDSGGMNVTVRGKLDGEDMYISNTRFLTRKNLVE